MLIKRILVTCIIFICPLSGYCNEENEDPLSRAYMLLKENKDLLNHLEQLTSNNNTQEKNAYITRRISEQLKKQHDIVLDVVQYASKLRTINFSLKENIFYLRSTTRSTNSTTKNAPYVPPTN